jgi:hypothetical protein
MPPDGPDPRRPNFDWISFARNTADDIIWSIVVTWMMRVTSAIGGGLSAQNHLKLVCAQSDRTGELTRAAGSHFMLRAELAGRMGRIGRRLRNGFPKISVIVRTVS